MQDPQPSSEEWLATLGAKAGAIEMVLNDARLLTAPPDLTNVHDHFVTANEFYLDAALSTLEAYEAGTLPSVAKLGEAVREIEAYEAALNAFYAERETGCSEETPLPQT